MKITRLIPALLGLLLGLIPLCSQAATEERLDYEALRYKAKQLASRAYEKRPVRVPSWLLTPKFSYDQHRDIRYKSSEAWWLRERLPFQMQFSHPGFIYKETVQLNEVLDGRSRPIEFKRDLFDYGRTKLSGRIPSDMGFSGFRILYPLNRPEHMDELAVFQGASYFRMLCTKSVYGLSARGLAIDTAEPTGEEFPLFEEFWIQRPKSTDEEVTVFALLDSPSVTGAYRFIIRPGTQTTTQIKCTLFLRKTVKILGVAPLTSMFWHGENSSDHFSDFRPEVHDSDGLQIAHSGGEWLWRPLNNPRSISTAAFADENPKGFGLLQRDRQFASYEDLEAKYHQRPSTWIETVGNWGKGFVRLIELPTPDETNDNIVAFWQPETLPPVGEPLEFEYKLHWFMDQIRPPASATLSTRTGHSLTHEPDLQRFVVNFCGSGYLQNAAENNGIEAVVSVGQGATLANQALQKNPLDNSWRVAFALRADGSKRPVELRCFLRKQPHVLSETWSYRWNP